MKWIKLNLLIAVGLVLFLATPARGQYVKTLGGGLPPPAEQGFSVIESSDGGIFVTGTTSFGAGGWDLLFAKFDASGNLLWTKTLGGSQREEGRSLIETSDSALVMTGYTKSVGAGEDDLLLAKFTASGDTLWTKVLGGTDEDRGHSVIQASDGGIVVTGYTKSFGAGSYDLLLAKFDASGNHLWTKTLGGPDEDIGWCVIQAWYGALVVTGYTKSFDADSYDLLLAKFNALGDTLWTRTLGGTDEDGGQCLIQTSDGGIVVTGHTKSFDAGSYDLLLAKFNASGNHLWTRTLGEAFSDRGYSVIEAWDGGLVVAGSADHFGMGYADLLLAKFDASGNHLWTRVLSVDVYDDLGESVIQTSNGDLIVTGWTWNWEVDVSRLILAKFDPFGNNCLGEFITSHIDTVDPQVDVVSPTLNDPMPDTATWSPTITEPDPETTRVCDVPPKIISISDVSNDQGKQVRVEWHRCYFDSLESDVTITEYSLWRRIDEDLGHDQGNEIFSSNFAVLGGGQFYPPGEWDFIKTVPARGEEKYNTVCPTLGDSTEAEGMYWSVFFVSAMTPHPLFYYDSEPNSGYSLDNIPPVPISDSERGLIVTGTSWDPETFDSRLTFADFDASGDTCLGEFVTPEFAIAPLQADWISLSVTDTIPNTATWPRTTTGPTPTASLGYTFSPQIVSISDIGNDQGKQVRVKWHRCYFDSLGSDATITEYSLWRRIGEDKAPIENKEILHSDLGVFYGGRIFPPGDWDFIKTVPARGAEEYNTVCPALGDATDADTCWSVFFVSAMTSDPVVYYDSEPDSGYSLDNIPPTGVENLDIPRKSGDTLVLMWMVPGEYLGQQPATAYDVRYSNSPIGSDTSAWWDTAVQCEGEPYPAPAGQVDSFMVTLDLTQTYYFAMKLLDDRPNYSDISNIVKFTCGDASGDSVVDVGDQVYLATYLFQDGPPPEPMAAGDLNCDGLVNIGDLVYLGTYLFQNGPPPCSP
jgi:hypothetical protein